MEVCQRNIETMGRPSLTIQDMQKTAQDRGGRCLSKRYFGSSKKLLWECLRGHRWKAQPEQVRHGSWCPACGNGKKGEGRRLSIQEMRRIAKSRGGKCLSTKYIDSVTKLLWQCSRGHKWEAVPANVKFGTWCPYCAGNIRLTISDMKDIAKKQGGRCISKVYKNSYTKLLWACREGHRWEAMPMNIKAGSWCPVCVGRKQNYR